MHADTDRVPASDDVGEATVRPGLGGRDRTTSTRNVTLTLEELLLLDGHVSDKAQKEVDFAKQALACRDAFPHPVYGEIIADSVAKGRFNWRRGEYQGCSICGKQSDYAPYQSGRNRGRPNYNKPRNVPGIAFNEGFLTIRGRGNFPICADCSSGAVGALKAHILANRLPVELERDPDTLFIHEQRKRCPVCHKDHWEFDSEPLLTLFGDGYYLGKCPNCGVGGRWGQSSSRISDRLIPTTGLMREKGCWQRPKEEECKSAATATQPSSTPSPRTPAPALDSPSDTTSAATSASQEVNP